MCATDAAPFNMSARWRRRRGKKCAGPSSADQGPKKKGFFLLLSSYGVNCKSLTHLLYSQDDCGSVIIVHRSLQIKLIAWSSDFPVSTRPLTEIESRNLPLLRQGKVLSRSYVRTVYAVHWINLACRRYADLTGQTVDEVITSDLQERQPPSGSKLGGKIAK